MKQTAVDWLVEKLNIKYGNNDFIITHINEIEQAKAMQDEQMQLTWNNAMDAVQKDKWHSYYEFYNNNFKSE